MAILRTRWPEKLPYSKTPRNARSTVTNILFTARQGLQERKGNQGTENRGNWKPEQEQPSWCICGPRGPIGQQRGHCQVRWPRDLGASARQDQQTSTFLELGPQGLWWSGRSEKNISPLTQKMTSRFSILAWVPSKGKHPLKNPNNRPAFTELQVLIDMGERLRKPPGNLRFDCWL